jgi:bacteriocin-like protein
MEKIMPKFHELSEDQLELVSGGAGAPNATALNAGVSDATTDARKAGGGQSSGQTFLIFQFKLVAV